MLLDEPRIIWICHADWLEETIAEMAEWRWWWFRTTGISGLRRG